MHAFMINERSIRGRNHHTFTSLLPGLLLTTYYHFSLPLILDFLHIKKKKKGWNDWHTSSKKFKLNVNGNLRNLPGLSFLSSEPLIHTYLVNNWDPWNEFNLRRIVKGITGRQER